ncbi:MAG: tRNA (guanosine(46)-N7)-methyltransferase TrmB [Clostridia bacterium]|nr:tRNA (guanosine(46)-N7)-methyltransferase TrmB [Clostridia bacterium]
MRVRKMKNGAARFSACGDMIIKPNAENPEKIDVYALFPGFKRFRLEIGCGKGKFVCGESERNPDVAYIAVELVSDVIIHAAEAAIELGRDNVKFVNANAKLLPQLFDEGTFERIHINFCDPWPKSRHEKRRLTYREFLLKFKPLLIDGGCIAFKTDNAGLFEYSLPEFEAAGFEIRELTRDLHNSEYFGCDTETEYEKNFSQKGTPINRLVAIKA